MSERSFLTPLGEGWAHATPGRLTVAIDQRALAGRGHLDLVCPALAENGLGFPDALLDECVREALGRESVRRYAPDARGQEFARAAIAEYYREEGVATQAGQLLLTPGTSMAYLFALKLLCRPGDQILTPRPGYPLLEDLCKLAGLEERHYHLREDDRGWEIDPDEVEFQITPRTRALLVVSPHNPTGHVANADCLNALAEIYRQHGLALLFDEVFCDTLAPGVAALPRPVEGDFPLTVVLNGLSKMLNLPGWKIAWMRIGGNAADAEGFRAAATHLADGFLAVNELAQAMVPQVLSSRTRSFRESLRGTIARRRKLAGELMPLPVARPGAGVYLCPRLPASVDDEAAALELLEQQNLLVHPGFYYGLDSHLVTTCLADDGQIRDGLGRIGEWMKGRRAIHI